MSGVTDTCPYCGNYTLGQMRETLDRKVTRTAIKKGWRYGLNFLGTITGLYFIGSILGFLMAEKEAEMAADVVTAFHPVGTCDYCCPKCGESWSKVVSQNDDYTTDQVLERQKQQKLAQLSLSKEKSLVKFCVSFALTVLCSWYCCVNPAKLDVKANLFGMEYNAVDIQWSWFFLLLTGIVLGIYSIFLIRIVLHNRFSIKEIELMNVTDYRNSRYREWK